MEWGLTAIGLLILLALLIWQHVLHQCLLNVTRQLEKQTADASADVRHRQAICRFMQTLSEGGAVTVFRGRIPANKETLH